MEKELGKNKQVNGKNIQILHLAIGLRNHRRSITRAIYQIGKMVLQGFFVGWLVDVLEDFEDDAGVASVVEVDFLV